MAGPYDPQQTPPNGPPQWTPPQQPWGPGAAGQGTPPRSWGYEDPQRTWEGWGPSAPRQVEPPFGPQFQHERFPELEPLDPMEPHKPPSPWVIAVGVVMALVLLAVAGAGIAYLQYSAPAKAATGFCNHLTSQDYGATYEDLATRLQAQYSPDAFVASARLADKLLGPVIACRAATTGSGYQFSLGGSYARVAISLTRAQAGTFSEVVTLVPDGRVWRLLRLDAQLFGVDLAPLLVASTVCVDLSAHDYASLFSLLDAHARGTTKQADFVQQGALHEQIDGPISTCAVLSVATSTSASVLSVILSVTRPHTPAEQGLVTLTQQRGTWQIDTFAANLLGSDLTPLTVGAQFCSALVAGNYAGAYGMLSDNAKGGESEQQFAYYMSSGGLIKWTGCTPDYTSYTISGGKATYTTNMQATAPSYGDNFAPGVQLTFVKQGSRWLVDAVEIVY